MRRVRPRPGRLPAAQRAVLGAEILGAYLRARRLVRRRDLPTTLAALRAGAPPAPEPVPPAEAAHLGHAVARTLRPLPDGKCLLRSLVLTRLLAARGTPSTFVLGVRPGERFAAHAWVELDGRAVLPTESFERLAEL